MDCKKQKFVRKSNALILAFASLAFTACVEENQPGQPEQDPSTCEGSACDETVQLPQGVSLTYLDLKYDLSKPVYVNNRVPIEYGLTLKDDANKGSRLVAVSFSFIEADPANPEEPIECSSSALTVELEPDGQEHRFSGVIWPTTVCQALVDKKVNLRVTFDGGEEVDSVTETASPSVTLSESASKNPINLLCKTSSGDTGCVYDIDIQPTPTDDSGALVDVIHARMASGSAVALLPKSAQLPLFSIESVLVINGRDPYISAMPVDEIPENLLEDDPELAQDLQFGLDADMAEKLIAMPGKASLVYELRPLDSEEDYLPLRVSVASSQTNERADEGVVSELMPGSPNTFSHELFAEGATLEALASDGAWGDVSDFEVRGCFTADFPQAGNEGTPEPQNDCQTFELVMMRDTASANSATLFEMNQSLGRDVGGDRLRLEMGLNTENLLDSNGASSLLEGNVSILGKIGKSFTLDIVRATAGASVGTDPAANNYEVAVVAFNQTVYEISDTGGEIVREEDFSVAKQSDIGGLGFGFGPVNIGISIKVGGEVGIGVVDALSTTTDADTCAEIIEGETSVVCGQIGRTTTPFFAFTADILGGVKIGPVSGGVEANLKLVNTEFPLGAILSFAIDDNGGVRVQGNALWNLELTLIIGDVSIVGRIRFRSRFLRRFNKTLRVHLFSFSSPTITLTLLDETIPVEVLQ